MSPKIRCQARHPREKYSQICKIQLTGKRIFHKGDHLTNCVIKTDEIEASPEFAHASPFLMNVFLTISLRGGSLHGFNLRRVFKHLKK